MSMIGNMLAHYQIISEIFRRGVGEMFNHSLQFDNNL
jgi:hypothetical protein